MNNDPMITHHIGRFIIQVPQSMAVARRSATFRSTEITEQPWQEGMDNKKARQVVWDNHLAEIKQRKAPGGKDSPILQMEPLTAGQWAQGVLYYKDDRIDDEGIWEVLIDTGSSGAWFKFHGLLSAKQEMLDWMLGVARAYHSLAPSVPLSKETAFYLEHGYIALPYLEQEGAYARFEGHPLGLKLRIQTNEIHEDEPHDEGLLGRLAATLATGFAAGVDIEKIRTGKREVGGLKGEETVLRAKTKDKTDLSFLWRYAGKKDSGDHPEIVIEIEAKDGQLEEKLKLWDAVLNSMKPVMQ